MKKTQNKPQEKPADNGEMQIIYGKYPPNFKRILEAFPAAGQDGVVFAYGNEIFVPSGIELTHPIKVHEATHGIRQKEFGLDEWWTRYIEDDAFRYYEELVAHFSEYMAMIGESKHAENPKFRKRIRRFIAEKLAHPLYRCKGGVTKTQRDLKNMEREYREGKESFVTGAIDGK